MAPWRFAFVTDIHIGSPRSFRFEPAFNENWREVRAQIRELRPAFVLVGGDQTRDGHLHRYELEAAKKELEALELPYHAIAGNMDIGSKWVTADFERPANQDHNLRFRVRREWLAVYEEVFGPGDWSFVHQGVRFTAANTILCGSGFPEEARMWKLLEDAARAPRERHHVFLFHYPLFVDRPDEPTWDPARKEQYRPWYFTTDQPHRARLLTLLEAAGASAVLTGHIHTAFTRAFGGIRYYYGAATRPGGQMKERWPDANTRGGFHLFDVSDAGLSEQFVPLRRHSQAQGYGPSGHPAPEARDYALAWEK